MAWGGLGGFNLGTLRRHVNAEHPRAVGDTGTAPDTEKYDNPMYFVLRS